MHHEALLRDWKTLCSDIGERRAGTAGERRAAEFIASEWNAAGLTAVNVEPFPCLTMAELRAEVHEPAAQGWQEVEAVPLVGTRPTRGTAPIEAELAWLDLPESTHRLRPRSLRGKILMLFGSIPTDATAYRRLVAAEPVAVIHVDERLPFPWAKNDGMYPYWIRRYGVSPTLTVPYTVAWRWRLAGVSRLKVRVITQAESGESQNVAGEIAGRDPRLPAILVTAHHDTQCNNTGADDNASGVVCLLSLARRLVKLSRPLRTVRFVSFGTEEQLSVGSDVYVRRHANSRRNTALVVNIDSVASPLGHFLLWVSGSPALEHYATRRLATRGVDVLVKREVCPFFDSFPFNRAGVPSLTLMRQNFSGGRWQHHSIHDSLENISPAETQRLLEGVGPLIRAVAQSRVLPFAAGLPAVQLRTAQKLSRDLLGV